MKGHPIVFDAFTEEKDFYSGNIVSREDQAANKLLVLISTSIAGRCAAAPLQWAAGARCAADSPAAALLSLLSRLTSNNKHSLSA